MKDKEQVERIKKDFGLFTETILKIKQKNGAVKPFVLNNRQKKIHERLFRREGELRE